MSSLAQSFIVVEPEFPQAFTLCPNSCIFRLCSLVRHMIKHVLNKENEAWNDLFSEDKIDTVLALVLEKTKHAPLDSELSPEVYKELYAIPQIQSLCAKYQHEVSKLLQINCETCTNHIHYGGFSNGVWSDATVECLLEEKNLLIIASSGVRNGQVSAYYIRTAYRIHKQSGVASVKKERFGDIIKRKGYKIQRKRGFVIHDKNI